MLLAGERLRTAFFENAENEVGPNGIPYGCDREIRALLALPHGGEALDQAVEDLRLYRALIQAPHRVAEDDQ